MSDWNDTLKPVATKLYADLRQQHAGATGALIEALEIARRRAEIDQTERDWRTRHGFDLEQSRGNMQSVSYLAGGNLLVEANHLFRSMAHEFGPQRTVHILTAIERSQTRSQWAADLKEWRARGKRSVAAAAQELGLSVEDLTAIEGETFKAGPEVMRVVRPALRRVKEEIGRL